MSYSLMTHAKFQIIAGIDGKNALTAHKTIVLTEMLSILGAKRPSIDYFVHLYVCTFYMPIISQSVNIGSRRTCFYWCSYSLDYGVRPWVFDHYVQ